MKTPTIPDTDSTPTPEAAATPARRPYEPPAVAWQEEWDIRANLAAACGKIAGDNEDCNADPAS